MTKSEQKILDVMNSIPEMSLGHCTSEVLKIHAEEIEIVSKRANAQGYKEGEKAAESTA